MSKVRSALLAAVLVLVASAARCETISQVKSLANWMQVTVEGVVTYLEPSECYIESTDRSGGIRVIGSTAGIGLGDSVAAVGTFAVVDGEPAVIDASIGPSGNPGEIRPFGMPNRTVGGASKWSPLGICDYSSKKVPAPPSGWIWERNWVPACGANNTGLLVTTWGTVKSTYYSPTTGARWFYIDDGSSLVSDYGDTGVLVYSDAVVENGQFVSVTGVSSTEPSLDAADRLVRVIRPSRPGDVAVLAEAPAPPQYPFSDEFESRILDTRWLHSVATIDYLSLTSNPGWLTVSAPPGTQIRTNPPGPGINPYGGTLAQPATGDWDLAVEMRALFSEGAGITQGIRIVLIPTSVTPPWGSSAVTVAEAYRGPSGTRAASAGCSLSPMTGDTCFFQVRKRAHSVYGSISLDGTAYCPEGSIAIANQACMALYAYSLAGPGYPGQPFTGLIDYVRFAPAQ